MEADAVAVGETAGIPFAAWIADRLGLPMLYVEAPRVSGAMPGSRRRSPRGHEFCWLRIWRPMVNNKIGFVEGLREAVLVAHCFVCFTTATPEGTKRLSEMGISQAVYMVGRSLRRGQAWLHGKRSVRSAPSWMTGRMGGSCRFRRVRRAG